MKIDKTSNPLPTTTGEISTRSNAAKPDSNKAAATEGSSTKVHLGTASAQLRSMETSISSASVVDAKKISEIKQAISEGRFQVNSSVVADKLINTVQDLISASGR